MKTFKFGSFIKANNCWLMLARRGTIASLDIDDEGNFIITLDA